MAKKPMTGPQIRKLLRKDAKAKLAREQDNFFAWWESEKNRDRMSLITAAWEAWKARAGVKAPH